jgi:hypothetical protein
MDLHNQAATLVDKRDQPTMAQLEQENGRLQRLVADLLIKNQQLRIELKAAQRSSSLGAGLGRMSNN